LRAAFGVDLIGLVSYDQRQFSEITTRSWLYVTVVGTLVVRGRKNETRTLMDTVVFDIPSRALLFHASGDSTVMDRSTPIEVDRERRLDSEKGFELATEDMIAELGTALEDFKRRAREGTVRGPGTPRVKLVSTPEMERRGGIGGGALGWMEALAAAGLVLFGRRWLIRRPMDG
jgi:rhombotail lipoprotein